MQPEPPPDIMGRDVSSKALQGAWSYLKASLGQEAPLPRQLTYMAGRVVLAVSERPKFSSTWASLGAECPQDMLVAFSGVRDPRDGAVETTYHPLYRALLVSQASPDSVWAETT